MLECSRRARARGHLVCGVPRRARGILQADRRWRDGPASAWTSAGPWRRPSSAARMPSSSARCHERALRIAAVGRDRRALRQRRHDVEPRHGARHPLSRRPCLRRPGLHGAQVARRRQRAGAVGRAHLRDGRDRRRGGRRRLFRRRSRCRSSSSGSTGGRRRPRPTPTRAARCCPPISPCLALARQQSAEPDEHMILPEIASQAADRARDPAGRRGLVQRRALDALCADRGRGARHHQRQRRRHEGLQERRGAPLAGARHGPRRQARPRRRLDAAHRSGRSATTASCSSATSGSSRP